MVLGSMNFKEIVASQAQGIAGGSIFSWNWFALFPVFIVYLISAVAETNRAPCGGTASRAAGAGSVGR